MNTNIEGKRKAPYAITAIKGVGRRLSHFVCKVAKIPLACRAGEISDETWEKVAEIINDPLAFDAPTWFLNRRKDYRDGHDMHGSSNTLESKVREDIERMKKIRQHRGLRHHWLLKVRGQKTKNSGRKGVAIGVVRKAAKSN